ncbi:MAG: cation:proton antiporter [Planctomycetaceae bacterium]
MHDIDLILTLTGGLTAALVLGYVTQQLRLSPIVGYLLAGVAVGPATPGFAADPALAEQLAEIGVILLMFGVGLHFHFRELLAVRHVAIPGALVQSGVATLLGAVAGRLLGWEWPTAIIFGGAISVASTVVLIRVLSDNRDLHTRTGHIAVGWLVVEDLLTVVALVLLPALLGPTALSAGGIATALALAAAKMVILVVMTVVVGGRVIPWVMERIAATRSRELFTLAVLVIALGIAVGSAKLFGVSMALGAFLAGMVVGRSEFSLRAASDALPMRDAFAVLFFVSVGMLFDPAALLRSPWAIAAALAIVLVAKPVAALAIVLALGYPRRVAAPVAVALAQIGEFSFILASLGAQLGVMPADAVNTLVATAIVSITLNPLLYRSIDAWDRWLVRRLPAADQTGDEEPVADQTPTQRAIVVGYGPVGQTVTQLLLDNDIEPTVIELNLDTVRRLKAFDVRAIYGDASRPEVLVEAGAEQAANVVLTSGTGSLDEEIIRRAKEINPGIHVLARAQYVRELPKLQRAGAEDVFAAEGEVALAFAVRILERLGASGEQIDRERQRVEATFRSG